MGAITEEVRRRVPASYRAMITVTEQPRYYSLEDLQALSDSAQFRLFATVVGSTRESAVYNLTELDFLGKVATLQFIPAAIDYWMDQYEQETITGTNESRQFPSRLAHLRAIFTDLAKEVALEIDEITGTAQPDIGTGVTYGDNGRGILVTPDPALFPAANSLGLKNSIIPSLDIGGYYFDDEGWASR